MIIQKSVNIGDTIVIIEYEKDTTNEYIEITDVLIKDIDPFTGRASKISIYEMLKELNCLTKLKESWI